MKCCLLCSRDGSLFNTIKNGFEYCWCSTRRRLLTNCILNAVFCHVRQTLGDQDGQCAAKGIGVSFRATRVPRSSGV